MFKVCIIGTGMIAHSAHIPSYRHLSDDFEITAVCDNIEENAKTTAEKYGIKNWYTSADKMLSAEKPDVVSVCVPNAFHKEYVMLAISHGCHVLCEKPLAYSLRDAVDMFRAAREKGVVLMAAQSMRFTPDRLAAKQRIDNGDMGDIYFSQFARIRRRGIPTWGKFHIREFSGGGAFIDIGVHMLDSVIWLMGNTDIKSVNARLSKRLAFEFGGLKNSGALTGSVQNARAFNPKEMDVEDFAAGSITFKNGAMMNFTVAWAANAPEETSTRLLGTKGGIDLPNGVFYSGVDNNENLALSENPYKNESFSGHFHIVDNLAAVLKGTAEPIIKPEETVAVAAILEMAVKSSELEREITLEEIL